MKALPAAGPIFVLLLYCINFPSRVFRLFRFRVSGEAGTVFNLVQRLQQAPLNDRFWPEADVGLSARSCRSQTNASGQKQPRPMA